MTKKKKSTKKSSSVTSDLQKENKDLLFKLENIEELFNDKAKDLVEEIKQLNYEKETLLLFFSNYDFASNNRLNLVAKQFSEFINLILVEIDVIKNNIEHLQSKIDRLKEWLNNGIK